MADYRAIQMDLWRYECDDALMEAYREYLHRFDNPVLYADDLKTWLEFDPIGQEHAERAYGAAEEADRG